MFFENRIKKEYRNEQIVRKKDEISRLANVTTIAKSKRSRSFLKLRVTNTTISRKGNTMHKKGKPFYAKKYETHVLKLKQFKNVRTE